MTTAPRQSVINNNNNNKRFLEQCAIWKHKTHHSKQLNTKARKKDKQINAISPFSLPLTLTQMTTFVDIQNALCKATVTHSESRMNRAQLVCLETENSAMVATVKCLRLIQKIANK